MTSKNFLEQLVALLTILAKIAYLCAEQSIVTELALFIRKNMLLKKLKNRKASRQLLKLKKNASKSADTHTFNNILFCPLNGTTINTVREGIIALSCQTRGAKASMLYLDSDLPISEFYNNTVTKLIYNTKVKRNIKLAKRLGFTTLQTSSFQEKNKTDNIQLEPSTIEHLKYKGILIGDLVVASTVRSFLSNGPDWNNPQFIATTRKAIKSAQLLVDQYTQLLNQSNYNKLVMSHGIYLSWGILFRIARSKGIAVDVYGSSYRKNTLRFYHNTPNAPIPEGEWDSFKSTALSKAEMKALDQYISGRATQKDDNISLFDDKDNIPTHITSFISQQKEKKLFCLFTNIAWDAFAFANAKKFSSMNDWIKETILFFNQRSDAALIIKAHPAEIYHKTPEEYRVRSYVNTLNLQDNILLITENESVKPFWLYEKIDFGLIHISTVGIEMALKNIPVLTSGANGHYSNKGFTIDPVDKEDYFQKLSDLIEDNLKFEPDLETAKRYMFYRFFREAIDFNVIATDNTSTINKLNIDSLKDLEAGKNAKLDIICNGILDNKKFICQDYIN